MDIKKTGIIAGVLALIVIIIICVFSYRKKNKKKNLSGIKKRPASKSSRKVYRKRLPAKRKQSKTRS